MPCGLRTAWRQNSDGSLVYRHGTPVRLDPEAAFVPFFLLYRSLLLTSTQNPTVKHLVRMRDNRARRRAGRVIVDGWRETRQAILAGLMPIGFYTTENSVEDPAADVDAVESVLSAAGDLHVAVSEPVMQKIAYGQSSRGVVAEFRRPDDSLADLELPRTGLVLVLDQFEKPGNIGAAFRCADAVGVDAVLLTPGTADRFNPNAIRSSLGTVFSIRSASAAESDVRRWLIEKGYRLVAARVESSAPLWESNLSGPVAIIIGSEAKGLGDRWQSGSDGVVEGIRIPMSGAVDSLNASVSAAVLLYEAARQRARIV